MSFFFSGFGDDDDFGGFRGFGKPKPKKDVDTTKYYKVLGLDKNTSQDDIRRAYRKLVKTNIQIKGEAKKNSKKFK